MAVYFGRIPKIGNQPVLQRDHLIKVCQCLRRELDNELIFHGASKWLNAELSRSGRGLGPDEARERRVFQHLGKQQRWRLPAQVKC